MRPTLFLSVLSAVALSATADVSVTFYAPDVVRIVKTPRAVPAPAKPVEVVTAVPLAEQPAPETSSAGRVWKTAALQVTVDAAGVVSFADAAGRPLLREKAAAAFPDVVYNGKAANRCVQSFRLDDDEPVYGLGDQQNGRLSHRGETNRLMIANVGCGLPVFSSPKGYLVYWDNTGPVWFRDAVGEALTMESEIGSAVDYFFCRGEDLDGAMKGFRLLTGDVPLLSLACYGFWQCRETYKTQDELVGALRRYRAEGIPVDGMIQDWKYWGDMTHWNAMEFLSEGFPDPKKMTDEVHALHAKLLVSVWPSFGPSTEPYHELQAKGQLLPFKTFPYEMSCGSKTYPLRARLYDAYSPAARATYGKYLKHLGDYGIDYWWMDATDTDLRYQEGDFEYVTSLGCTFREVFNAYPYATAKGVYEQARATDAEHRPFILTRAGHPGIQRFAANVWSGDLWSRWDVMRNQIPAGLGFSMSGLPLWNCDLGGWSMGEYGAREVHGAPFENNAWRELYVRWVEFGAFLPMMRSHGSGCLREIYWYGRSGEPVYDALVGAVKLRYRLLPYIYSTAWQVCRNRASFLRPVDNRTDAYLFGDALFVQPVMKALYTDETKYGAPKDVDFTAERPYDVTLPAGRWYSLSTGEAFAGGRTHRLATTLATIPAFVRAGSVLPIGPDVQYATEKAWDDLELRVYPGADGSFVLYEDAFDGFGYERGEHTEIELSWRDAEKTLTIGARRGGYPGQLAKRRFRVTLPDGTSKAVEYAGAETRVCLAPADGARWIWYPGDYGLWWGNELQSQRLQWGARLTPYWPMYAPEPRVLFRKRDLDLRADEPLEIRCDGHAAVCYWDRDDNYVESAAVGGRFTLPKDARGIEIKVQNTARPPSVWVKGPHLVSDSSWRVGTTTSWDREADVPAESSARFADPATPPGLKRLPVREKPPVWVKPYGGNHVIADFGEETYGYLRLKDVKGAGAVKVIYAESESEMYAEDLANVGAGALDGWEQLELTATDEYRRTLAHGFRYVHVIPVSGDVTVGSVTMDCERKDVPVRGSFRCNDEEVNRIWEVAAHTLGLTCREVFIEGVKRDHWVWSGDAAQSFLMNYYVFGDYDGCRDTLWTLRGKDPVKMHLNRIMDYTFYWFDAVERYWLYSGDAHIARQVYPRMKTLLAFALGRLDGAGRPADRPGDWIFIDWAPKPLPNNGGVTSVEQMLLVRALEATASVADEVGARDDAASLRTRAERLRAEIVPRYWNEAKGGLMHMIYNDGQTDPMITRYPNMFGLFYGYFDDAQRARVVRDVLFNDDVMKIQTPYMRFYELESLCALGRQEDVLREIKSYWGGMLRLGATSFWELYNPAESGGQHYAMYGRRFGKSLCHAWGASPAYLLGRYFLGVRPTSPGFATYEVKPQLGGLEWIEGDVPTPWGKIHVRADKNGHTVKEIRL